MHREQQERDRFMQVLLVIGSVAVSQLVALAAAAALLRAMVRAIAPPRPRD